MQNERMSRRSEMAGISLAINHQRYFHSVNVFTRLALECKLFEQRERIDSLNTVDPPLSAYEAKSLVAGEANGENTSRQVMPRSAAVAHSQAHLLIFTLPSPLMNSHVTSN